MRHSRGLGSSPLCGSCVATNIICAICPQFGNTALHEAALNDHDEIIKLLLKHKKHKANIKLKNNVTTKQLLGLFCVMICVLVMRASAEGKQNGSVNRL